MTENGRYRVVDRQGRITLPAELRKELGYSRDMVVYVTSVDGVAVLLPVQIQRVCYPFKNHKDLSEQLAEMSSVELFALAARITAMLAGKE